MTVLLLQHNRNTEYSTPQPQGSSNPFSQLQGSPVTLSRAGQGGGGKCHSMGASLSPGHYMVVSTSKGSLPMGHKATLTSAPYQPSAPAQCLAFWYQLSTGDPGEPHVPLAKYHRSAQDA